jgi:hypothetical protein
MKKEYIERTWHMEVKEYINTILSFTEREIDLMLKGRTVIKDNIKYCIYKGVLMCLKNDLGIWEYVKMEEID